MQDQPRRRAPRNTAQEAADNPTSVIANAMMEGTSQSIYNQEAEGQRSFVNSETLPTEIRSFGDWDAKEILEAAGVKFLGPVEGDPLFQYVELPEGWKKVGTDHSMHSRLLDDKDRERASIFYKAAFYDRRADLRLTLRFGIRGDGYDRIEEGVTVAHVTDCGEIIHTTEPITIQDKEKPWVEGEHAKTAAQAWLDQHYTGWEYPGVYWD